MGKISKTFALILTVLVIMSGLTLLIVKPANSETTPYPTPYPEIPKPNVPKFTVRLIDSSYDIPASNTIDPYTGQTSTQPSQHIEARTIEIRIKNEPFTPFEVNLGTSKWTASYQYNIRWKGHFEEDWHNLFFTADGYLSRSSESPETVFSPQGEYSSTEGLKMDRRGMYTTFPPNSELDFQVQALIGFVHREVTPIPGGGWLFTGEVSDWSSTQTLTIGETSSTSPTPKPTPTPSVPELSWLAIIPLMVSLLSVAVIIRHRKTNKLSKLTFSYDYATPPYRIPADRNRPEK
jgi:hypothetical protein